jgi:hypothetical protein
MFGTTLLSALLLATAGAGAEPPPSPLALEAVLVTPESPAADTLCRLTVKVSNRSDRPVTALAFTVSLGDHELPVYRNQIYLQAFPPGTTTELRLYNFWTSETGRPAPGSGVLPVKVTLREAKYVTVTKAENGDETWQLGEAVGGLPVVVEKVLRLGKK